MAKSRKKDKFQSSLQDDMNQDSAWLFSPPAMTGDIRRSRLPKNRLVADEVERRLDLVRPSTSWKFVAKPQRGKPADSIYRASGRRGRPVA